MTPMDVRTEPSDADLVRRMARGDRPALASLYERHAGALLILAERILRSRADAEELLHDVFLEAWTHSAEYVEEKASVRTWLALRTRSRALDRLKSKERRRVVYTSDPPEPVGSLERSPYAGELGQLDNVLGQLPEVQREVLVLGYFEGLSCSEIALRIGAPLGTVKSRIRNALAALRSDLNRE
jgi:RNA polymerase sigma-70 factor (ECF subfamily)